MKDEPSLEQEILELVRVTYQNGVIDGKQGTNCEKVVVAEISGKILKALRRVIEDERKRIQDFLLEKGSGGGSWRRLIEQL